MREAPGGRPLPPVCYTETDKKEGIMKIAISLDENKGLDSQASNIFGRCNYYLVFNVEDETFTIEENPAKSASGGAGIQAAQWIINQEAEAVVSGNLGPKAYDVLAAGKIAAYRHNGGTAQEIIKAYKEEKLECLLEPNVDAHSGLN